ncbi:MAG: hypothetical protein AB7O24_34330 [Kofleriaceae bacterium]
MAKGCGDELQPDNTTTELEAELQLAQEQLSRRELEEMWSRYGRHLREHDPETYRLLHALVVGLAALSEAPVEN